MTYTSGQWTCILTVAIQQAPSRGHISAQNQLWRPRNNEKSCCFDGSLVDLGQAFGQWASSVTQRFRSSRRRHCDGNAYCLQNLTQVFPCDFCEFFWTVLFLQNVYEQLLLKKVVEVSYNVSIKNLKSSSKKTALF